MQSTIVRSDQRQPFFRSAPPTRGVTTKGTGGVETSIQEKVAETVHSIAGKGTEYKHNSTEQRTELESLNVNNIVFPIKKVKDTVVEYLACWGLIPTKSTRKVAGRLQQLEVHHKRPVGFRYDKGLLHGLCIRTNAIKEANSAHVQLGSINVDPTGSRKVDKQG